MAAQTLASEKYGTQEVGANDITFGNDNTDTIKLSEVQTLAEVKGTINTITCTNGKIASVEYTNSGKKCTYTADGNKYEVES